MESEPVVSDYERGAIDMARAAKTVTAWLDGSTRTRGERQLETMMQVLCDAEERKQGLRESKY